MLGYWPVQLGAVLAADPATPAAFGRTAEDANRLGRIEADRHLPTGELLDRIEASLDGATTFSAGLTPADIGRVGVHPTRGDLTVGRSLELFLYGHLEGHVAQLRDILARPAMA
jgi:hypothetical protein